MMTPRRVVCCALCLAFVPQCFAPPPLVTGDVPTAPARSFELYAGTRYQDTGSEEWQAPFTELVYGLADRWEVIVEAPYVSREGEHGFGDVVLGTKYVLLVENETRPGIAGSYEVKLDNADASRGLGSGGFEHDLRLRAQKTWGWFTPIVNVGYIVIPDAEVDGVNSRRKDAWRASFAQEWQVAKTTKLLSEIYWQSSDEPGGEDRLAWNAGFKHKLRDNLTVHAAVGKSLREHNRGGPDLRIYAGVKWEFGAPWKNTDRSDQP